MVVAQQIGRSTGQAEGVTGSQGIAVPAGGVSIHGLPLYIERAEHWSEHSRQTWQQ